MTDAEDEGEPKGYLIVYTGTGRDKTDAALGLALRAVGNGQQAIFVYFTGPSHPGLSELKVTAEIGDNWRMVGIKSEAQDLSYLTGFYAVVDSPKDALTMAHTTWLNECNLLVLDDITAQLDRGSIDIAQVLALIDDKPLETSIVLTGPSAPKSILQRADLITNFLNIK